MAPDTLAIRAAGPRRRVNFFKWLRRMHAWIGLWGAALGLLFGTTGLLLNHRQVLKIPAGRNIETAAQIELAAVPESPDALARQLAERLGYRPEQSRARPERAREIVWNGETVRQPERWNLSLDAPDRFVRGEYYPGNRFVSLKQYDPNLFSLLNRLHMSSSHHPGWILLADTLAGGMLFLVLSGTLLWTRLHGPKLAAVGLAGGGLAAAVGFALAGF